MHPLLRRLLVVLGVGGLLALLLQLRRRLQKPPPLLEQTPPPDALPRHAAATPPARPPPRNSADPPPMIISKIESTEALDNLAEIIAASDGIMVARGDLGVEIPLDQVVTWQKDMVAMCIAAGKPVVVATQASHPSHEAPYQTSSHS